MLEIIWPCVSLILVLCNLFSRLPDLFIVIRVGSSEVESDVLCVSKSFPLDYERSEIIKMKAWGYQSRGPASKVLRFYHDLPKPVSPKADEVLIKVSHVVSHSKALSAKLASRCVELYDHGRGL